MLITNYEQSPPITRYLWCSSRGFLSRKSWIRERAATWTPATI